MARLERVAEQSDLFNLGLMFYEMGEYQKAVKAFENFLAVFPSREVYHNLALSYHQIASRYVMRREFSKGSVPFKMPMVLDPHTRASRTVFRSSDERIRKQRFEENIDAAIANYEVALKEDPQYLLAYINLASAHLMRDQAYKAIAVLQDAQKVSAKDLVVRNLLAMGYYLAGDRKKSYELFDAITKKQTGFADAYYNYGKILYDEGKREQARTLWTEYSRNQPTSAWSYLLYSKYQIGNVKQARHQLVMSKEEKLAGLQVGLYMDELPAEWKMLHKRQFAIGHTPHHFQQYRNGITTLAEGDEILAVKANRHFKGKTGRGVAIGNNATQVIRQYGIPALKLNYSQGEGLAYPEDGITFLLQGDRVVSWVIY